jgi:hypothetical protein
MYTFTKIYTYTYTYIYIYMHVYDPEPELEPEPEPYSIKMSEPEPEPSSNFPVPQPCVGVGGYFILLFASLNSQSRMTNGTVPILYPRFFLYTYTRILIYRHKTCEEFEKIKRTLLSLAVKYNS